jgi:hypothetical protein
MTLDDPQTGDRDEATDRAASGYTFHVDFTAACDRDAALLAIRFAEGLGRFRVEVDTYSARLSPRADQADAQPLFCHAIGPHGERCADEPCHTGFHAEAGLRGFVWADNDRGGRWSQ